jgi:hypothetical protein
MQLANIGIIHIVPPCNGIHTPIIILNKMLKSYNLSNNVTLSPTNLTWLYIAFVKMLKSIDGTMLISTTHYSTSIGSMDLQFKSMLKCCHENKKVKKCKFNKFKNDIQPKEIKNIQNEWIEI